MTVVVADAGSSDRMPIASPERVKVGLITSLRLALALRSSGHAVMRDGTTPMLDRWADDASTPGPATTGQRRQRLGQLALLWTRMLFGQQRCLIEAVIMAAGLSAIGIASDVVFGPAAYPQQGIAPLHAWLEIDGRPVSEMGATGLFLEIDRIHVVAA
jgi:hypothetical protein